MNIDQEQKEEMESFEQSISKTVIYTNNGSDHIGLDIASNKFDAVINSNIDKKKSNDILTILDLPKNNDI